MYWISSRLELREVVSNATRRWSMSMELGAGELMPAPSHTIARDAKSLKLLAKLRGCLTPPEVTARTASHPSWLWSPGSKRAAEGWPSGRRRRFAKPLMGVNPIRGFESHPLRHYLPETDRLDMHPIRS